MKDVPAVATEERSQKDKRGRPALLCAKCIVKPPPRFVADAMLGSLARKLRIFGFDTSYFAEGDDLALEKVAKSEKRVILTSDKRLFALSSKKGVRAILVEGETDLARLRSIAKHVTPGVTVRLGGGRASRCAVCNGELQLIEKGQANASKIPPQVLARHRLFYTCRSCSRFYWRGKHWDRLRRLSYSLHTKDLT